MSEASEVSSRALGARDSRLVMFSDSSKIRRTIAISNIP